jgi:hypothetical protein
VSLTEGKGHSECCKIRMHHWNPLRWCLLQHGYYARPSHLITCIKKWKTLTRARAAVTLKDLSRNSRHRQNNCRLRCYPSGSQTEKQTNTVAWRRQGLATALAAKVTGLQGEGARGWAVAGRVRHYCYYFYSTRADSAWRMWPCLHRVHLYSFKPETQ